MSLALIKSRSPSLELSQIKAIELAAARRPGSVSLAQGIPSFNTPKVITDFVIERINSGACDKYSLTNGLAELREEISLALGLDGMQYDPDSEIIVTAGSIEAITATLLGCTKDGDEIIIPSPTYTSYRNAILLAGCTPRYAALNEEKNFDLDIDKIENEITAKTKAIFYCNPNNPTGTIFSKEQSLELLKLAEKYDLLIITDEVYKDFYFTEDIHFTPASIHSARSRIIRVCSFSKAFAMTGWRIAYLHADRSLVSQILPYHDTLVTCAPVVSQYAAIAALRFGQPAVKDFREQFRQRRNIALHALDSLSHVLDYQIPKASYFVFPRIKDSLPLARESKKLAYDILDKVGLAIVPGVAFGPSGESHLRISFGRELRDVEDGMSRLSDYFSKVSKSKETKNFSQHSNLLAHESAKSKISTSRFIAQKFFKVLAIIYLWRNQPTIIGITGTRSKTVFKRTIAEFLSEALNVRSSILSYNTEIGLPLSILNLSSETTLFRKVLLILKAIFSALVCGKKNETLLLEYGIRSELDGSALSSIAKPDWLILTPITSNDPSINSQEILNGIKKLASHLEKDKIIWVSEDLELLKNHLTLDPDLKLDPNSVSENSIVCQNNTFFHSRELPGVAYKLATLACINLAIKLGISSEFITRYLARSR
ncbi:MAG: aminotransferase class I/II-fold pyridoxal phosphate-dependent enzyme [bacterium]|nr:aminotransferase class I/II-fold pyridoxal phosphate-dependent enzyme [bacterium]